MDQTLGLNTTSEIPHLVQIFLLILELGYTPLLSILYSTWFFVTPKICSSVITVPWCLTEFLWAQTWYIQALKPNLQQSSLKFFHFQVCTAQVMRLPNSSSRPSWPHHLLIILQILWEIGNLKKIWSLFSMHALHSTQNVSTYSPTNYSFISR